MIAIFSYGIMFTLYNGPLLHFRNSTLKTLYKTDVDVDLQSFLSLTSLNLLLSPVHSSLTMTVTAEGTGCGYLSIK